MVEAKGFFSTTSYSHKALQSVEGERPVRGLKKDLCLNNYSSTKER